MAECGKLAFPIGQVWLTKSTIRWLIGSFRIIFGYSTKYFKNTALQTTLQLCKQVVTMWLSSRYQDCWMFPVVVTSLQQVAINLLQGWSRKQTCYKLFCITLLQGWSRQQTCYKLFQQDYTRKNAQVVTGLQTRCYKSVHKLSASCVRTVCSDVVATSLEQAVNNL